MRVVTWLVDGFWEHSGESGRLVKPYIAARLPELALFTSYVALRDELPTELEFNERYATTDLAYLRERSETYANVEAATMAEILFSGYEVVVGDPPMLRRGGLKFPEKILVVAGAASLIDRLT